MRVCACLREDLRKYAILTQGVRQVNKMAPKATVHVKLVDPYILPWKFPNWMDVHSWFRPYVQHGPTVWVSITNFTIGEMTITVCGILKPKWVNDCWISYIDVVAQNADKWMLLAKRSSGGRGIENICAKCVHMMGDVDWPRGLLCCLGRETGVVVMESMVKCTELTKFFGYL